VPLSLQAALAANAPNVHANAVSVNAAIARKLCVPNSSYFKSASQCNVEENKFLDFVKVLGLTKDDAASATAKAKADHLTSTIKKLESDGASSSLVPEETVRKSGRHDQKLAKLRDLRDGMQVGAASLNELDEWQMYHINECFRLKNTQRSLPNLSGVGRCIFNLHEKIA
jgi:hypothetical protein